MGDFIVFLVSTDPTWQPTPEAAERTADEACRRCLIPDNMHPGVEVKFFTKIRLSHPHENLERISCPRCTGDIDLEWFERQTDLSSPNADGFDDLHLPVPCCGAIVSLADLRYDWPAGFSRFRITLWNPELGLIDEHVAELSALLGHELRIIHAHA
ncbi:hypothetical protein ACQP1P_41960 [Dactylosporangium sp. CA-052675]|uniref:hypothetical protein n=1 Tax=Dactylosporangium sp. CA-052675 TaxID=3239927 RepID=UPI003D93C4CF